MNHDYDDKEGFSDAEESNLGQNPFDKSRKEQPGFDPFDDDTYEEPDRDTDHPGAYAQEHIQEEEEIDHLFPDNDLFEDNFDDNVDDSGLIIEEAAVSVDEAPDDLEEPDDLDSAEEEDQDSRQEANAVAGIAGAAGTAALVARRWDDAMEAEPDSPASWQEEEEYFEEGEAESPPWPMGLIAVAVLALVLLIAGGYGVIQQRKATSEEVRQLRAELATATSQTDVDQSRSALQEMKSRNDNLQASITQLSRENRRLSDTVAGLETQLDAQQSVLSKGTTSTIPAAAPKPVTQLPPKKATAEPAAAAAPVTGPIGDNFWFVNFGSYGQREVARGWVAKLNPPDGETILIATEIKGKTLYRVRVVGLSNRESAEKIARSLEQEYKLSKLWVGKQ